MGVLDGKVAMVTGAGQGIGRGIALAFAKEGAAVAVVGRTAWKLVDTVDAVTAVGGAAVALTYDLSTRVACDAAVVATVAALGGLDVLVNNAASTSPVPLVELTDDDIERDLTALRATMWLMQASFPYLQGGGKVINFGSGAGTMGAVLHGSYAAAKEGIRGLSKVAAKEWGPLGVTVNVVCPGVLTPMSEAAGRVKGRSQEAWAASVPVRRVGDPERDIGRVCVFLAGPDADYITGRTLHVDGGMAAYDM